MVICLSGDNAMPRLCNYEIVWLCKITVIYRPISRYGNKVIWLYGCMAICLYTLETLGSCTLYYILYGI